MATEIIISRPGPPEVLRARDLPAQALKPDEVRIAVAAAGINFADVVGRLGNYPDAPPMPYCPGYEVSGKITGVGSDVDDVKVGDRVCAFTRFGGYTTEVAVSRVQCFSLPDGVDLVESAGVPVTHITAYTCLFDAGGLTSGKTVLIHGGAGGVGSAAIQMAQAQGDVTIIATCGSSTKVNWLREHGVAHPINYNEGDLVERVARITEGRGVDLVLDPVGGRSVARSVAMCAPLGRVILYGASALSPGKHRSMVALVREGLPMRFFNLIQLFNANVGIHAINMLHLTEADPDSAQRMMTSILRDVASGALSPVISERFPLTAEGAIAAHHYIQDRKNIGKVLLVSGAG